MKFGEYNTHTVNNKLPSGVWADQFFYTPAYHPQAYKIENDFPWFTLNEETYDLTVATNTDFLNDSYRGRVKLIKIYDKENNWKLKSFWANSTTSGFYTKNLINMAYFGELILEYTKNGTFKLTPQFSEYSPVINRLAWNDVVSGTGSLSWGYWESEKCEKTAIETSLKENALKLTYKKINELDLVLQDLIIIKNEYFTFNNTTGTGPQLKGRSQFVKWPEFTASLGVTRIPNDSNIIPEQFARKNTPKNTKLIENTMKTETLYLSTDPITYSIVI
jgi:hypothetical protein